MLIFARNTMLLKDLKEQLIQKYQMSDLGEVRQFLGLQIYWNRKTRTLYIGQWIYIDKILERFNMHDCNSVATPMESTCNLRAALESNARLYDPEHYQAIVGCLMYVMIGTQPDLAFPVSVLSRFNAQPTIEHNGAAKRVL